VLLQRWLILTLLRSLVAENPTNQLPSQQLRCVRLPQHSETVSVLANIARKSGETTNENGMNFSSDGWHTPRTYQHVDSTTFLQVHKRNALVKSASPKLTGVILAGPLPACAARRPRGQLGQQLRHAVVARQPQSGVPLEVTVTYTR
jgi:hypothetical protein